MKDSFRWHQFNIGKIICIIIVCLFINKWAGVTDRVSIILAIFGILWTILEDLRHQRDQKMDLLNTMHGQLFHLVQYIKNGLWVDIEFETKFGDFTVLCESFRLQFGNDEFAVSFRRFHSAFCHLDETFPDAMNPHWQEFKSSLEQFDRVLIKMKNGAECDAIDFYLYASEEAWLKHARFAREIRTREVILAVSVPSK